MPALNVTHTHYHYHFPSCPHDDEAVLAAIQELKHTMTAISDQLDALRAGVERIETAEAAVAAFVAGVPALIQTAVDAAIAAGATPAELASFTELNTRLTADADKIAADVTANTTPPDPTPVPDPVP